MKAKYLMVLGVLLMIGLLMMVGCSSRPESAFEQGPEWTYKGSGAFDVDKGKVKELENERISTTKVQ